MGQRGMEFGETQRETPPVCFRSGPRSEKNNIRKLFESHGKPADIEIDSRPS
jgi:hypothetical protein